MGKEWERDGKITKAESWEKKWLGSDPKEQRSAALPEGEEKRLPALQAPALPLSAEWWSEE